MAKTETALFREVAVELSDLAKVELALAKARARAVSVPLLIAVALSSVALISGVLGLALLAGSVALALGGNRIVAVAVAGITLLSLALASGFVVLGWVPSRVKRILPEAQAENGVLEST